MEKEKKENYSLQSQQWLPNKDHKVKTWERDDLLKYI